MNHTGDIKEKISKLFALAGSPNGNEARAARLKAQELMAKHNLRESDIPPPGGTANEYDPLAMFRKWQEIRGANRPPPEPVRGRLTAITSSKTKNAWAVKLSGIISGHYNCKSYSYQSISKKEVTISLDGAESDVQTCEPALAHVCGYVEGRCKQIRSEYRKRYKPAIVLRMQNAYGFGFCEGLRGAPQKPDVKPKDNKMDIDGLCRRYFVLGYQDGMQCLSEVLIGG